MTAKAQTPVSDCIGHTWRGWDGGVYLCTRYVYNQDFWMRLVQVPEDADVRTRRIGDETCISIRAINRTYHRADFFAPAVAHESPCDCETCNPELPHRRW